MLDHRSLITGPESSTEGIHGEAVDRSEARIPWSPEEYVKKNK